MDASVKRAIQHAFGSTVQRSNPVSGGDINEAYDVVLEDGRRMFVKTSSGADPAMFPAEAKGLAWLGEAGALRVPRVLAVSGGCADEPGFIAMELIRSAPRRPDFDEALGRGIAALHRSGAPSFGLDHDNFIGRLHQRNEPAATWATFYRDRRLEPQLRMAAHGHLATQNMKKGFDRLFAKLESLVGPPEPPSRLHGDLWGGNHMVDDHGAPCIIDPAVYGGHREVDLAMMKLFGGYSRRVFDSYAESYPLPAGHESRVSLYQLYFLMVHVNLFGGSYVGSVERTLDLLS